ncbi:MAG TPA: hypothetical protein PK802_00330 [Candidatus Cloacimonadota bacterium]|jgi:GTPase SAR1 family protein|nr:hypothetical protein [Candidatus Cloacimonadota bacterium]HOR58725.1 hypothetical protein [Candidatus Cloacimonadota bacterium]HPB08122.1 hypothetical protein [Candidatus Cloacimonadota bacterium]HQO44119.1 hypothetical protein [Candidatus Cloacimonadota bacterium]HQP17507.1 hypothetical protein [Candidatus Cloacimonadota bacterium]
MNNAINPFQKLGSINDNILHILALMDNIGDNELSDRQTELTELYRKSFIMQTLTDRYVIAVTGTQGVGKTTLLAKLYNVEDGVLPTNQGRGEQIPILFTERKPGEQKAYMHRIACPNGSLEIMRDEIDRKKVQSLSMNYNPTTDLFIELEVPEAVFYCDTKHFLLLPGIESKNDYMYNLTWSALRTAANCVIVMFSNAYAREDTRTLIQRLNEDFKNSEPVFVLTMADQTTDGNESFKKTIMHDLNIEEDRIVISGTSDDLIEKWPERFKKTLQRYSASTGESIKVKCDNMKELLADLKDIRIELDNFLKKFDIKKQFEDLRVDRYLLSFNTEFQKIRNEICDEFHKHMDDFENRMNTAIQKRIKDKSFWQELWNSFIKRDITRLIEFQQMIADCLGEAIENHFIELGFLKSIESSQITHLYANQIGQFDKSLDQLSQALVYSQTDLSLAISNSDLVRDIIHLYHPDKSEKIQQVGPSFENTLKTIPHLFTELVRLNLLVPNAFKNQVEDKYLYISATPDTTKRALEIYSEYKPTLSNALGAIIGLDMAMDGQLDLFNILENFIPQTAGKLAESVTAAIGVAMIVFHSYDYLSNLVNRTQIRELETAHAIVADIRKHIENEFIHKYDRAVRIFSEYTVDAVRDKLGISKNLSMLWNLEQALYNLRVVSNSAREEIRVIPC